MKHLLRIITSLALLPCVTHAQKANPFESINKNVKMHTLSHGKYTETYDDDVLQRVGTVLIDRRTRKIVKLLDADSVNNEASDNSSVSMWYSIDPLAEKYYSISPYAFCNNNPIRYIDPDGMKWLNANDEAFSSSLQEKLSGRIETEDKNLQNANDKVASLRDQISKEGASDKLSGKLSDAESKVASITTTISDLTNSVNEIAKMGNASDQTFTFDHVAEGNEIGGTEKKADGVIHIGYLNDANAVHEAAHGYDNWRGTMSKNPLDREMTPYQRQYSFDPRSMDNVPSDYGRVNSRSGINQNWILLIHNSVNYYPYMEGNKTPSSTVVKQILQIIRDSEKSK